ncbi:MAG: damage-control phosphatase ARMT1 family protein, partial [Acidimicrobiia bacterium]|nr:damage-control phosphatase ARMT1 family protein [Acidimicrobiia bacterium]
MAVRLPEIARRTIAENDLGTGEIEEVALLIDEIESGSIRAVSETEAPDAHAWASYVERYAGMSWLDAPWFFVETYFYRRLLAATGYSRRGKRLGVDPFAGQKQAGLDGSMGLADGLAGLLHDVSALVAAALRANQVDLSLWPAGAAAGGAESRTRAVLGGDRTSRLVVDDADELIRQLDRPADAVLAMVLDNAGAELIADLALAAAMIERGARVVLHAKAHPTFVSDATATDVLSTIRRLAAVPSPARRIGDPLTQAVSDSTVRVVAPSFWVSPCALWNAPPGLVD